ncbi:MAG: hypothetical protein HY042_08925 [Spirochaetia bacterium]|nr:hypothetical protein [Spirochaetia bacterium]
MFSDYFLRQGRTLESALNANLEKKGAISAKEKDLNLFREFYTFMREHLPAHFALATGKVRNKKHLLGRNCDLLVYNKWCPRFLEMTGGYVLSDYLYAFMSLEVDLTPSALLTHLNMTNAMKSLYSLEREVPEHVVIPMFSVQMAYRSSAPLLSLRTALADAAREKEIPVNHEPDMICILNQGLIIKDWENGGQYKVVETGADTLLWFYVLFLEYLDRDNRVGISARDYVKTTKEYKEY